MKDNFNLYWYGMLTTGNAVQVEKLFHQLLDGKFYTSIAAHPRFTPANGQHSQREDCSMHVRTSQKLSPEKTRGGDAITVSVTDQFAHLSIHDSYGVHMISTELQGDHVHYDSTFKNPYIVFDGNQVTVSHRNGLNELLVWTFAVEKQHDCE